MPWVGHLFIPSGVCSLTWNRVHIQLFITDFRAFGPVFVVLLLVMQQLLFCSLYVELRPRSFQGFCNYLNQEYILEVTFLSVQYDHSSDSWLPFFG